ncbi:substrate-binding domain-containing protein [Sciscionella marina]|uniref:substrate-binding domain-containing protein n=1 Tax=Sciscionella marina TaxID=508770 RepID=UPI0012F6E1BD|nr:substrate-binding domain-containing protein [Sciscionella marina]
MYRNRCLPGSPTADDGRRTLRELLDPPAAQRLTAAFASIDGLHSGCSSSVAPGTLGARELSVVGFDNAPFGELAAVSLTTVDASPLAVGSRAVELRAERIRTWLPGDLTGGRAAAARLAGRLIGSWCRIAARP